MQTRLAGTARADAAGCAASAGVVIRQIAGMADAELVRSAVDAIWRPPADDPPLTAALLRALEHSGNYCAIATDRGAAEVVGVCVGWLGTEPVGSLHSHIAGVLADRAGGHVGAALKLDQRAWALDRGLSTITWTYDPLVRRNAYFNIAKLGALPESYHVDFYGEMLDAINDGQGSDRISVHWPLAADAVARAAAGAALRPAAEQLAAPAVLLDGAGGPVRVEIPPAATVVRVQVPPDIEQLRRDDAALALRWRRALREVLEPMMSGGWRVVAFARAGSYVLTRQP